MEAAAEFREAPPHITPRHPAGGDESRRSSAGHRRLIGRKRHSRVRRAIFRPLDPATRIQCQPPEPS